MFLVYLLLILFNNKVHGEADAIYFDGGSHLRGIGSLQAHRTGY